MWELDVSKYSKNELLDLFGLNESSKEDDCLQKLVDAFRKVSADPKKSETEKASFMTFVSEAGRCFDIEPSKLHSSVMKEHTGITHLKNQHFAQSNHVEQYDDHMLISTGREIKAFSHDLEGREAGEKINPAGRINPSKIHTISKALNIDSRFRDNYYNTQSTSFTVNLPTTVHRCTRMNIGNLAMPLTYYTFSRKQGNTTFVLTLNGSNRYVITLPDGNYASPMGNGGPPSATGIEQAINNAMSAAGINTSTQVCYRVDRTSGKSTFAVASPGGTGITSIVAEFNCDDQGNLLESDNLQLRCGWMLGFRVGRYEGGPGTSGNGAAIVSEGICFPDGPRYGFLGIDEFQSSGVNDYFYSAFTNSMLPDHILSRIELGNLKMSSGAFQMSDIQSFTTQVNTSREYFGPINIDKLKITLYDEYGRVLDLNNMDWSLTLSFDCAYD